MLIQSPGFTLVAVLTLALGIGANSALFSVMNAVLLKPLPYDEPDRLVYLTEWSEQVPDMSFSLANFKDLRDQTAAFEAVTAQNGTNFVLTGAGREAERLNGRQVTSGIFATLRKQPIAGRAFTADEDKPGADRVMLLGEGFWERRFGRDPGVVGRSLNLSGETFTVIGVMPGTLHGSWKTVDVFTPLLRLEDKIGGEKERGNHPGIFVVGRLKPGVSVAQARTEVVALAERLAEQYPDSNTRHSVTLVPLHESVVGELRPAVMLLLGAVAFVLLIACANVANLLLARAAFRQKEIAIRMAMGAKRWRLLRQLMTESVLLSLVGGFLGVLLAYWGVRGLVAALPSNIPRADEIRIDSPVLLFTLGIALFTGLAFGIAPAWQMSSIDVHDPLKDGGRGTTPGHHRVRNLLVVSEIALALILLVGAGLLLRSFSHVLQADAGFRAGGVLTVNVSLPGADYDNPEKQTAFLERVLENARALPGVEVAGATIPLLGGWQTMFTVEGLPEPPIADVARVSPGYFRAMGVRVKEGRVFTEQDRQDTPRVCVIDETFARTYWPNQNALGKRVKFGPLNDEKRPWLEVVGVVGHVKNYGVDEESRIELYMPYLQDTVPFFTLLLRTEGDPASLTAGVRQAVTSVNPDVPVFAARPLTGLVDERTAQRRLAVILISVFAGVALLLAAVGIYGVMSYAVTQRTQEIGIRLALGARRAEILRMVLRHGTTMALAGVGIGLVVAFGLARLITSQLFQVSAADPPTFSIVSLVLIAVAVFACYLPARRATAVDPMVALRSE